MSLLRKGRWALALTAFFSSTLACSQGRIQACAACHGPDGNSVIAGTPSIAGQPRLFLENQLVLIREGVRSIPSMAPIMKGMTDKEIQQLAAHFSKAAAKGSLARGERALQERGRSLAQKLRCASCHEADYRGREQMPRLAAQREDYLADSMIAYRDNKRSGGDTVMAGVLYGVSNADLRALAHYLAALK